MPVNSIVVAACLEWMQRHLTSGPPAETEPALSVQMFRPRWSTLRRAVQLAGPAATGRAYPFEAFTGGAQRMLTAAQEEAKAAGLCDALTKPMRQSQLFDAVIRAVAIFRNDPHAARQSAAQRDQSSVKATRNARILLAEDNEVNQIVASEILAKAGFQCDIVGDGKQAVEAIAQREYDLVLMDCQMPEMDGFQAATAIRQRDAAMAREGKPVRWVPVVALTANALKGDRELCLAAGMDEYLCKPLDPRQLISTLNRLLNKEGTPPGEASIASEAPASQQDPPFDLDSLLSRCMGDVEFRDRLLTKFPEQAELGMRRITDAVRANDAAQLARAAHGLKGTAANLSAASVQRVAAELEALGHAGTLDQVDRLVAELQSQVDRCIAALQPAGANPEPQPVGRK